VLPTGLLILGEVLHALGVERCTVTTRGLRYGLLLRLGNGDLKPTWTW
jgi:exopolyphosphatase/pppGpp-phosphohydrolase